MNESEPSLCKNRPLLIDVRASKTSQTLIDFDNVMIVLSILFLVVVVELSCLNLFSINFYKTKQVQDVEKKKQLKKTHTKFHDCEKND